MSAPPSPAKDGDTTALRLCMERPAPAVKSRAVSLSLPAIETPADILKAQATTIQAPHLNADL
jgi:hypothetical protein